MSAPKSTDSNAAPGKTLTGERDRFENLPAVEVELIHEVRRPPAVDRPWAMLEVWTQNRVYSIDVNMVCIEVVDIGSKKPILDHGLIGARLLGGQLNDVDQVFLSHPFPRPGTEAVFEQPRPADVAMFSHSSTVTRVVLRMRQLTIVTGGEQQSWDQIAGSGRRSTLPQEPEGTR
ncbi:MAG: hypothetical protein IPM79_16305 [Polyangiaceae bacterium]|jgi:hypothetical protein|nr:hypothetical protein [Polyangiaceae bacterium]MBK8939140.1 hypothetical protein [Polyangiaceae bacterium]